MKDYNDLKILIGNQASAFQCYIDNVLHENEMFDFFDFFSSQTDVYVFSGVIRDFLLGYNQYGENRDYDFVIRHFNDITFPRGLINGSACERNKFGGIKIVKGRSCFDVWGLEDTWGIVNKGEKDPDVFSLLQSTFFNFSSIVFDYKNSKFIIGDDFCKFYQTKSMDVVYKTNPYKESCIVSAFYYANRYDLIIGSRLKKWIVNNYSKQNDYQSVQIKRFGRVVYNNKEIEYLVGSL